MDYQKYEQKLNAVVANPDSAPTAVLEILTDLKADSETFAAMQAANTASEQRIRDLQDTNHKLFLSQTSPAGTDDEEEKTADEILDELFKEE